MKVIITGQKIDKSIKDRLIKAGHTIIKDLSGTEKIVTDKTLVKADVVYVLALGNRLSDTTQINILKAKVSKIKIFSMNPIDNITKRTCPYAGCSDPLASGPCALCYE